MFKSNEHPPARLCGFFLFQTHSSNFDLQLYLTSNYVKMTNNYFIDSHTVTLNDAVCPVFGNASLHKTEVKYCKPGGPRVRGQNRPVRPLYEASGCFELNATSSSSSCPAELKYGVLFHVYPGDTSTNI